MGQVAALLTIVETPCLGVVVEVPDVNKVVTQVLQRRTDLLDVAGVDAGLGYGEAGAGRRAANLDLNGLDTYVQARNQDVEGHHAVASISMITARGCPYRCTWCSHAVFGYSHRRRSPADCADELEHIIERFSPDQIWYADDVFTISHPWLESYAKELRKRGIRIPFETISRADRMMKPEVLDTLAEIGCDRIWIGSESGSQRILDAMQRDVTTEQVQWASQQTRLRGIKVGMFLMWGYGDETADDIESTVEHVIRSNPDTFLTTVAYPIKGTPFFDAYADDISLSTQWASSSDRDYTLGYQRSPEYYQAADALLFNSVEAERFAHRDPARADICLDRANTARELLHNYEKQRANA